MFDQIRSQRRALADFGGLVFAAVFFVLLIVGVPLAAAELDRPGAEVAVATRPARVTVAFIEAERCRAHVVGAGQVAPVEPDCARGRDVRTP